MSENGPKRCQKSPKNSAICTNPRNQARTVSWATWLKIRFRGHLVHPQPPTFCGFHPSEWPNETRRPRTSGHLVQSEGSPARARRGPTVGPPGSLGRKKSFLPKLFPDHLGCSNTCFWPVLSPWWRVLGHGKSQNALKMGHFWDQKWVKNGSKRRFSKNDPGPFGMLKQVFLAHFEPVLTEFSPFHHMHAPLCALRTHLRALWWSHLELGEGCRLEDIYIYIHIYMYIYIYMNYELMVIAAM